MQPFRAMEFRGGLFQRFISARLTRRSGRAREATGHPVIMPEALEVRRLFAVSASLSSGTLTITGTSGDDVIKAYKKSSDSTVTVYSGANVVSGSPFSGVTFIVVNAGDGNDTVTLGSTAHGTGSDIDSAFDVPISAPAEIDGGNGNDTLKATDHDDVLTGGDGTDTLNGAAGNDALSGNLGNDTLNGESGNDTMSADSAADGADVLNGGIGADTADYSARPSTSGRHTLSINNTANDGLVDADTGTAGNQNEGDNIKTDVESILGSADDDDITGSSNNDTLDGGDGDDVIWGGAGDDVITGDAGADLMYGESGNDSFFADDGVGNDTIDGGSGTSDNLVTRNDGDSFSNVEIYT